MMKLGKNLSPHLVYFLLAAPAGRVVQKLVLKCCSTLDGKAIQLLSCILFIEMLYIIAPTYCRIYQGASVREWRTIMKNNIVAWIMLLVSVVAFVVLMAVAYKYMDDKKDAFSLIIASLVLFVPNIWTMTEIIGKKTAKKTD